MHENSHKLRVYTDLLYAITELKSCQWRSLQKGHCKKSPALNLNRLNRAGSIGVLKSTNDLLDFLNGHKGKKKSATPRLYNILKHAR